MKPLPLAVAPTQAVSALLWGFWHWALAWWRTVQWGAALGVLALSPSSYARPTRLAATRHIYLDTAPILLGFTLLCALLTLVITHIVVSTASSYGLSLLALEVVIRVLVLELIPLVSALFVALRCTIPHGASVAAMRRRGRWAELQASGADPLLVEALPRMLSGLFATITLAMLSCVVAAALVYLSVYGFSVAGEAPFARVFGRIFTGPVALIFALKTLGFALAVAVIPVASGLLSPVARSRRATAQVGREAAALLGLVRLFAVLLLLELASLAGNYY